MRINISIEQIDNGFLVSMFDVDGKKKYNEKVISKTLPDSLRVATEWTEDVVRREVTRKK